MTSRDFGKLNITLTKHNVVGDDDHIKSVHTLCLSNQLFIRLAEIYLCRQGNKAKSKSFDHKYFPPLTKIGKLNT